jgi:hypothetical protein
VNRCDCGHLHLSDQNGRIVEGVLPDQAPEFGVGNDSLNVVYLYGVESGSSWN